MDITKTLGNNALLRFGTRRCALQNVIKILLMGQRGVETRVGKAARSRRVHMRAGRPCVQRREGGSKGRHPPSAPIPPSPSNLLISIPTQPLLPFTLLSHFGDVQALVDMHLTLIVQPAAQKSCCLTGWSASMGEEIQQNPLQKQGHGSRCRQWSCLPCCSGSLGFCSLVPAPVLSHGHCCLPGHGCGKGTGRVQAVPGWPASSMSVTAVAGERKRKKHAV